MPPISPSETWSASPQPLQALEVNSVTLTEQVFEAIKSAIVEKRLPPGSRVSESALASQLRVSKTPVREALIQLRHIGLVNLTDSGLRVVLPSREAIRDAYQYRAGLERISVELCSARADKEGQARVLEVATASLREASEGNREGFREQDQRFHILIAQLSGNRLLASRIDDCLQLTSVLRVRDIPATGDSVQCAKQHIEVAKAINAGDAASAADAMQRHVECVMGIVLGAPDGDPEAFDEDRALS